MKRIWLFLTLFLAAAAFGGGLPVRRTVTEGGDTSAVIRKRNVPRTLMFAEIQSYLLVENYLHYFSERPLFHDSSLRGAGSYENSFKREVASLGQYNIDGFCILACDGKINEYASHLQTLTKFTPFPGFRYMPGASYPNRPDEEYLQKYLHVFRMAVASPYTAKIDGKIPIWGYRTSYLPEGKTKELAKFLKDATGVEPIIFSEVPDNDFRRNYIRRGRLTKSEMTWLRYVIRKTLDNADGVMLDPVMSVRNRHDYTRNQDSGYMRDCVIPIMRELLQKPEYRGKYIGGWVNKGYMNQRSGNNTGEYGTSSFRIGMEEMMRLNPDIIVFFEWNEFNENTHFMPTVNNGTAMRRLVRYYAARLRGEPPQAEPDADRSVPNVIFSSRKTLRLGDTLRYEILNVPESDSAEKFTVQLRLYDIDRKVIETFAPEEFPLGKLRAVTYEIPTEALAQYPVVVPELTVRSAGQERTFMMHYNRIHPSICYSYKEIMQPLRDVLPVRTEFRVTAAGPEKYLLEAEVSAEEKLAQVEVLDHDEELCAVDREKRYDPENNVVIRGSFTAFAPSTRQISFQVHHSANWRYFREHYRTRTEAPDPGKIDGRVVDPNYLIHFYYPRYFYITVPKTDAGAAELEIDVSGMGDHRFSVAELLKKRKYARTLDENTRLDLEIAEDLVDIPAPLDETSAKLRAEVYCRKPFPVYQLRAISRSGRIFRSFPVMPRRPQGELVRHPVFSAKEARAVEVKIAADRIPELKYLFDPEFGAMMKNSYDPWFDAQLGGGFLYIEPFNRPRPALLAIPGRGKLDPQWVSAGGETLLRFDGKANYINFPREAFPYGSFTLEFEIRPASDGGDVLFRHRSHHSGFLNLYRRNNRLTANFTYRMAGYELTGEKDFDTGLEIPTGKWSKVTVSYDLATLRFTVNGKSKTYPFRELGVMYKPSVFGGPVIGAGKGMRFFHGDLRSFRIRHTAE